MKTLFRLCLIVYTLHSQNFLQADIFSDLTKKAFGDVSETSQIFTSAVEEKKKLATTLHKDKLSNQEASQKFNQTGKIRLDEITNQSARIKIELKHESEHYPFLEKKLETLNETAQVLSDIPQSLEHISSIITTHIRELDEYLKDPELKGYLAEYQENRPYSFEDMQALNELRSEQERNILYLGDQEKNASIEFENRKRSAQGTIDTYKKRQEILSKLAQDVMTGGIETEEFFGFDIQQKTELLRLETQLYDYKKQLDDLRLQEIEYKLSLIKTKIFISKLRLDKLRVTFRHIKPLVKVRESEILAAKAEFAKKKQASFLVKEGYRQEIERIASDKERRTRVLDTLSKRYNVVLDRKLDEWALEPRETVASYIGICEVGDLNEYILLLDRKREYLEAQMALEDEKISDENLAIDIKESYFKITSRQYISEEEIRKEIKQYGVLRAHITASISGYRERKNAVVDLLHFKKSASEHIKSLKESLNKQKNLIFSNHQKEFARCLSLLNDAEHVIAQEIDLINKITGTYSDNIEIAERSIEQIDFIISELDAITIWYRPEYAISWQGIQNIVPDIERFLQEIYSYTTQISPLWIVQAFERGLKQPTLLFYILFKILFILIFVLIIKGILPHVRRLLSTSLEHGSLDVLRLLVLCVVEFLNRYFIPIAIWCGIYLCIYFDVITDQYIHIIFYLLSIPYLLYLADSFKKFFVAFNMRHNYSIISQDYLRRFVMVLSILLYATIIITCFRQALILGIYHKSELPAILLALNVIILQISLIFLITKELVLSLIPRRGSLWQWLHETVDHYYYPILVMLIAIIVMINPYVGFGQLVLFALRGFVYTLVLIRLLFFGYEIIRKILAHIFFSTDDEVVQERFVYAKSWYGLFIIVAFLVVAIFGMFIIARIWGWLVSLKDIYEWLETPLLYLGQEVKPVTIFSVFQIFIFCLFGFALSMLVNRFLLRRIFDLLLVDSGVQNTITSFTRYFIIIAAIMFGFKNSGLGELVIYLTGALILSIGWVIKDPISDFMAYFIILVQRPVKIGDYIWMDDNTMGVVRKITPRSVIIRRKNSTTIVLPNTHVLNKPLANWNYVQGFFAFEDITIMVGYKEDPERVKTILAHVLDRHPYILKSPKPVIRLEGFTQAGFEFMIRGFLSSNYTLDQWDIASDVRIAIVKELRKQGIEISVPMRIMVAPRSFLKDDQEFDQIK